MLLSLSHLSIFVIAIFIYLIPIALIIYWMVRMLKNTNENNRLLQEILEHIKKQ
ncbi:MAG: hypothetical protein JSS94_09955 [Bacteroidetes bacterium]|nr:hypothetical protein [Bacteroidota bacterium]